MPLHEPSTEQKNIITFLDTCNIIVEAVPGSGKTETNLHISKNYSNKKILMLTYNKKLKLETRKKVKELGFTNVTVLNYHAFCVKYYDSDAFRDDVIHTIIKDDMEPTTGFEFDVFNIDETQDMTPLYYSLVVKIYKDNLCKNAMFCILGDSRQSIYDFNGADSRYISFADQLLNLNSFSWKRLPLTVSFRMTKPIVEFVNKCMLGNGNIISNKNGNKVKYIIGNIYEENYEKSCAIAEIMRYIDMGYKPNDIFILAPSIKNNKCICKIIANYISNELDIPVYIPVDDDEKLSEKSLANSMIFSTFHQVKGLERKVVLVFNFDKSYFDFYNKNANPEQCPNELYVACTRALEQLTVFHDKKNGYLPFLKKDLVPKICELEIPSKMRVRIWDSDKNIKTSVAKITDHLHPTIIQNVIGQIAPIYLTESPEILNIPSQIKQTINNLDLEESISSINEIALKAHFECKMTGKMQMYDDVIAKIDNSIDNMDENEYAFDSDSDDIIINKSVDTVDVMKIDILNITPKELLYLANIRNAQNTGYDNKLNQIKKYDWLSENIINKSTSRLKHHISKKAKFNIECEIEDRPELFNRRLEGTYDCIDGNTVWILKFAPNLLPEHIIQTAIYSYIYHTNFDIGDKVSYTSKANGTIVGLITNISEVITILTDEGEEEIDRIFIKYIKLLEKGNTKQFYLFNVSTNEIVEISGSYAALVKTIETIIKYKNSVNKRTLDSEFLKLNDDIRCNIMEKVRINDENNDNSNDNEKTWLQKILGLFNWN